MAAIPQEQLAEIYAFAVQLGKDAGKMLMDAVQARIGDGRSGEMRSEEKESAVDIVTKTDEGKHV